MQLPNIKKWRLPILSIAAGAVVVLLAFQNCAPRHPNLQEEFAEAGPIPVKHGDGSDVQPQE